MTVKWIDKTERNAEVVDRREEKDGSFKYYYVHFTDFDRRMDEWVHKDRIVGHGSKVADHHGDDHKADEDRDELTMGTHAGSGALSAPKMSTSQADAKRRKLAEENEAKSEFTAAEHQVGCCCQPRHACGS